MKTQQQTAHTIAKAGYVFATLVMIGSILLMVFGRTGLLNLDFGRLFWPCGMHDQLHLYCPGCGGTRAMRAMLQGHFIASLLYNPCILIYTVSFLWYYVGTSLNLLFQGKKIFFRFHLWVVMVLLFLPLVFGIIRDLLLVYAKYDYIGDLVSYWQ